MSKKNKQKFKKRIKAQILTEMAQSQNQSQSTQKPSQISQSAPKFSEKASTMPAIVKTLEDINTENNETIDNTKYDLKKSAVIIGSIIILIIGLYVADSKTDIILKSSNKIFSALNINL